MPNTTRPLIVEGAGGLLVPLNEKYLMIDLISHLGLPVILVCRSTLGTINHTLLSIEALRTRGISIAGVVLVGPKVGHNRQAIIDFGKINILGELPFFENLSRQHLIDCAVNWNSSVESTR
jgi:dethiobiotin synthetase